MKVWTRDEINALVKRSNLAVERGIILLYNRQTKDEQQVEDAKYLNNRGFSSSTAKKGTYYARWILSGRKLSGYHLERAREIVLHHSQQLVDVANHGQRVIQQHEQQVKEVVGAIISTVCDTRPEDKGLMSLHEHCHIESGGLTGRALEDYINRYYGFGGGDV